MGSWPAWLSRALLLASSQASYSQDVVEPGPDELPAVLGQPQGLWHCLWLCLGLPSGCQIHLTHQCNWEPVPGPADKVAEITDGLFTKLNSILAKLKSVLLVENVLESIRFAVAMYLLTYIGALMNGLTIVTLAWVAIFSLPRVYRDNQKQIDEAINPLKSKLDDLQAKLQSSLPASIVGKKEE